MATYQISERIQIFPYQVIDRGYLLQTTVPGAPGTYASTMTKVTDPVTIGLIEAGIASWVFLQDFPTPQILVKIYTYTF